MGSRNIQLTMSLSMPAALFNRTLSAEHVKVDAWHLTCLTI